jgi:putative hemolysin
VFEIILILACLSINAILSCIEMAFVTLRKQRLRELAKGANPDSEAAIALEQSENPERTLSAIQVGITIFGALAAAVGGAGAEESLNPALKSLGLSENASEVLGVTLVVIPLTYFSVVLGELVPKSLALRNAEKIVLRTSRGLKLWDRLLSPIVVALEWSTRQVLALLARPAPLTAQTAETFELEPLSKETRQYVLNLTSVENRRVREVMLPWARVITADLSLSMDELENLILSCGHTRLPVVKHERTIGMLNTKEFLALRKLGAVTWETIVRPVVQVQEHDPLLKALRAMQTRRSHLSLVLTTSGAVAGIVTMEDIFEEIVGDIHDEDDDEAIRKLLATIPRVRSKTAW